MRKIYYTICLIIIILLATSCAGASDWEFELPNDFQVWHINSKEIKIVYTGSEYTDVSVPSFIKEFAYEKEFVFTRNIDSVDDNNLLQEKYYMLDTKNKKLYGPYKEITELKSLSEDMEIKFPEFWYRTSLDPNTIRH